jgi:hypothetical protein
MYRSEKEGGCNRFRIHMHCVEPKSMRKTLKQVVLRQINTGNDFQDGVSYADVPLGLLKYELYLY